MENLPTEALPAPPGIIKSLKSGFDAVASHFSVLLLPILLDILLWFGPRLSVEKLWKKDLILVSNANILTGLDGSSVEQFRELLLSVQNSNMFMLLRTFPIGIPSLMASKYPPSNWPTQSPMGNQVVYQVPTAWHFLGWIVILVPLGWALGAIYYNWISRITIKNEMIPAVDHSRAIFNTLLLMIIWTILLITLVFPIIIITQLMFFAGAFQFIHPALLQLAWILIGIIVIWLTVPVFFSPHGIFIRRQNAFASILSSLKLARYTLPNSSLFIMTLFIFSQGFSILWSVPENNSWMAMVGIFGHAFISTALVSASFVYYQEMTSWLQVVIEQLQTTPTSNQV